MDEETVQKASLFCISVSEFKAHIQVGRDICNFFTCEVKDYL